MELNIKGEYKFNITYQNMFNTYTISYYGHNIITDEGLKFLINKWASDDSCKITKMIVGRNNANPTPTDSINTFHNYFIFNIDLTTQDNQLIMTNNQISGKHLNNTTEIGVIGENIIDDGTIESTVLISRSTHPTIQMPETSIISIEYIYTLTSKTIDECTEEE